MNTLVEKYNIPGPRYTSYPTVPYWDTNSFKKNQWLERLQNQFKTYNQSEGISIYVHLPFCESLCTFCGCHKRITKRHEVEAPYLQAVLKEWSLYKTLLQDTPLIKEIHLGGGTPTFFTPKHLTELVQGILANTTTANDAVFSFEGHPNNTTKHHLQALFDVGFRRVSFGVQDYNLQVQKAINRIQPYENVEKVTRWSREIGYNSIGHDLIFGLPFQTTEHIKHTIEKTNILKPERIAFYSYAHVPWIKGNGQRGFSEENLPTPKQKRKQYEIGKHWLEKMGYVEIGMDHFALPNDQLYKASQNKTLHRNFMGYTTTKNKIMIGLGVSSISDSWNVFAQNEKKIEDYYAQLEKNEIPVYRGHILTPQDQIVRKHILNLMCNLQTTITKNEEKELYNNQLKKDLEEFIKDGIVKLEKNTIFITETGRPFVRNVCMKLDLLLKQKQPEKQMFSMTI